MVSNCMDPPARPDETASLVAALLDPDVAIRLAAAYAMRELGRAAVRPLLDAFAEADLDHRLAIIQALGVIGKPARSALPVLEQLTENTELAATAALAIQNIRYGPPLDWNRLCSRLGVWFLVGGIVLEAGCLILHWVGHFSQTSGMALQISAAWAVVCAFVGAVLGAGLHGRLGVYVGANYLGIAGACVGAFLGEAIALLLGPLLRALQM